MSGARRWLTFAAFIGTFVWLVGPDPRANPAALWPSVLAVGLAFLTRDIYLALFLGAFSGALLLHAGNPWIAFQDLFTARLLPALTDRWNLCVLLFTLMMGGWVGVMNHHGGMTALSVRIMGRSSSSRRAGLGAYLLGWVVFFDGLANALLVGKTLRPAADRAGMSREKLAFIVDSTSSPIAGLALLSTWVAYEMSVIRQGLANTGDPALIEATAPYAWLVLSLPFRFYNWFMLLLVFLVIWTLRDWGPMLQAERARRAQPPAHQTESTPNHQEGRTTFALVPLTVLIAGVFGGLFVDGGGLERPFSFSSLIQALGDADAALVFVLATAVSSLVALGLPLLFTCAGGGARLVPGGRDAFMRGMQQMFLPALILVFAWVLNSVIQELETASYLVSLLGERLPAATLPTAVFLLAATISFSTGTSWGTMAIVMPLVVPLAVQLTGYQAGAPAGPALIGTVGAVLAGAVFGDHCSPISDTTIVSAFSSDCEVIAHVRTQLPYALAVAGLAVVFGYGPAGYGVSSWLLLVCGGLAVWALVRFVGKPA